MKMQDLSTKVFALEKYCNTYAMVEVYLIGLTPKQISKMCWNFSAALDLICLYQLMLCLLQNRLFPFNKFSFLLFIRSKLNA